MAVETYFWTPQMYQFERDLEGAIKLCTELEKRVAASPRGANEDK